MFCYCTAATTKQAEASSMCLRMRHGPSSSNKLQGFLPLLLIAATAALMCCIIISPVEAARPASTGKDAIPAAAAPTCIEVPDETTTECRNRSGCAVCLSTDPRHLRICVCCKPGRIPNPNNTAACIPVGHQQLLPLQFKK
jgi:hypothetical protein